VPPARMRDFLARVEKRELPGPLAKQCIGWLADERGDVDELLKRHGVEVKGTADTLRAQHPTTAITSRRAAACLACHPRGRAR